MPLGTRQVTGKINSSWLDGKSWILFKVISLKKIIIIIIVLPIENMLLEDITQELAQNSDQNDLEKRFA